MSPEFTKDTWTAANNPLPCTPSDPDPDTQIAPQQLVGTALVAASRSLSLQEEVRAFKDATEADQWDRLVVKGFACSKGTLGTAQDATIAGPQDLTKDLGVDDAGVWQITTADVQIALVVVRHDNGVAVFLFAGPTGADTSGIPSPLLLAKKGVAKLA